MSELPGSLKEAGIRSIMDLQLIWLRTRLFRNAVLATSFLLLCLTSWFYLGFVFFHNTVQELKDVPIGNAVHLVGCVTHIDPVGERFWLQDDSGAIVIGPSTETSKLHVGELVGIEATKTAYYDPISGPTSVALKSLKVISIRDQTILPRFSSVTLKDFAKGEKSSTRIQTTGIIRGIEADGHLRAYLIIGEPGAEAEMILPQADAGLSKLIDARVSVVGVRVAHRLGIEHRLAVGARPSAGRDGVNRRPSCGYKGWHGVAILGLKSGERKSVRVSVPLFPAISRSITPFCRVYYYHREYQFGRRIRFAGAYRNESANEVSNGADQRSTGLGGIKRSDLKSSGSAGG
jgi:hypothetical protein